MTQHDDSDRTRDIGIDMRQRVTPPGAARHGLVVGIETYREKRLNLRCARADAQTMYDLMTDPGIGLFPTENVQLLLDENATREKVWQALARLRRSVGRHDTVWIFYAGHGAPEGDDAYWVTHDADVDDLFGTALASRDIHRVLGQIPAERLVTFLDCCHAAATMLQANPPRDDGCAAKTLEAFTGKGRITFSSSDGHEKSVELPEVGHGAFTYYLSRGLRGEADIASDGVVLADRLWQYLDAKVSDASRRVGNPQTPKLIGEMSHGLALTLNPAVASDRQQVARALEGLVGLGENRLRTDEAEFCLDVLRRSARSEAERHLLGDMKRLANGSLAVGDFRRLLHATRATTGDKPVEVVTPAPAPVPPRPKPAAPPVPAAPPPFAAEVARVVKVLKLQVEIDGPFTWDRYVQLARWLQSLDGNDPESRKLLADADAFAAGRTSVFDFLARLDSDPARRTCAADLGGGVVMQFIRINPGEFLMGSPSGEEGRQDNEFQHKVRLTKAFMLGVHPVTRGQFAAFVNATAYKTEADNEGWAYGWAGNKWDKMNGASWQKPGFEQGDEHPVVCVSWNDAVAFNQWLSGRGSKQFRLPSEAEWEYACRAGTTTPFHTGPTITTEQANYNGGYTYGKGVKGVYRKATTPVGLFKPNPWGLFDMHGNVWEWCADAYGEYPRQDAVNPTGCDNSSRVLRGGSWNNHPLNCRAACRYGDASDNRNNDIGFRVSLDL